MFYEGNSLKRQIVKLIENKISQIIGFEKR